MFRKTIALVIGLSMILPMSLVSFSIDRQQNIVTNAELESSFEIIEPKVKIKKELYIRDNLLVSISLSKEFENFQIPVGMNLYAVEKFVGIENRVGNGRFLDDSVSQKKGSLDKAERIYNLLFERQVNESILVEKSGLLPYFKYTYKELNAGQYRLEFIRKDNEVIVKTVDFSINKKNQLTEKKIKENITESLNILYNNN